MYVLNFVFALMYNQVKPYTYTYYCDPLKRISANPLKQRQLYSKYTLQPSLYIIWWNVSRIFFYKSSLPNSIYKLLKD